MQLITSAALEHGEALIRYAYACPKEGPVLTASELIGVVAAYINYGHPISEIRDELGSRLHPELGRRAEDTLQAFSDWWGKGLWQEQPSLNDIRFTNRRLERKYPYFNSRENALARETLF